MHFTYTNVPLRDIQLSDVASLHRLSFVLRLAVKTETERPTESLTQTLRIVLKDAVFSMHGGAACNLHFYKC